MPDPSKLPHFSPLFTIPFHRVGKLRPVDNHAPQFDSRVTHYGTFLRFPGHDEWFRAGDAKSIERAPEQFRKHLERKHVSGVPSTVKVPNTALNVTLRPALTAKLERIAELLGEPTMHTVLEVLVDSYERQLGGLADVLDRAPRRLMPESHGIRPTHKLADVGLFFNAIDPLFGRAPLSPEPPPGEFTCLVQ